METPGTQLLACFDCSSKLLLYLSQLAFFFGLRNSLLHLLRVELCSQKHFLIGSLDLQFEYIFPGEIEKSLFILINLNLNVNALAVSVTLEFLPKFFNPVQPYLVCHVRIGLQVVPVDAELGRNYPTC